MLLGINITLFGGIIAVDPNSNLAGVEYIIALTGLIISIVGLEKNKDLKDSIILKLSLDKILLKQSN
ncbi:MAG: hypothetical protein FH753_02635 [Firmicutes bacterium]|nr:hypothetical protein [Bacillota bacterium]